MSDAAIRPPQAGTPEGRRPGRAIAVFVSVAFGFSWLAWPPLVFSGPATIIQWYFYLGSMGPAIGAPLALGQDGGLGSWARRAFSFTGIGRALAMVVVSILLCVGVGLLVERLATGSMAKISSMGLTSQLPGACAAVVAVVWVVTFGIGEETWWRGWLMPTLTGRFGFFAASLMVAGIWLAWHLPQFIFNTGFRSMGWTVTGWIIALVAGSFWLARLGPWSIVAVVLFHGGFDLLTSSDLGPSALAATASTLVMVQAALVIVALAAGRARARTVRTA